MSHPGTLPSSELEDGFQPGTGREQSASCLHRRAECRSITRNLLAVDQVRKRFSGLPIAHARSGSGMVQERRLDPRIAMQRTKETIRNVFFHASNSGCTTWQVIAYIRPTIASSGHLLECRVLSPDKSPQRYDYNASSKNVLGSVLLPWDLGVQSETQGRCWSPFRPHGNIQLIEFMQRSIMSPTRKPSAQV